MEDIDKDKIVTWQDELRDDFRDLADSDFMNGCINAVLVFVLTVIVAVGIIVFGIALSYH